MGRGIGSTQREILNTLNQYGPYYLVAVADGDLQTRYKSLHRAACRLHDSGKITVITYCGGKCKVVICPAGTETEERFVPNYGSINATPFDRDAVEATSKQIETDRDKGRLQR